MAGYRFAVEDFLRNKFFSTNFLLSQILTEHGSLHKYHFRFKLSGTNKCRCDPLAEQNTEHFIFYCSLFNEERNKLQDEALNSGLNWPLTWNILLISKNFSGPWKTLLNQLEHLRLMNISGSDRHFSDWIVWFLASWSDFLWVDFYPPLVCGVLWPWTFEIWGFCFVFSFLLHLFCCVWFCQTQFGWIFSWMCSLMLKYGYFALCWE